MSLVTVSEIADRLNGQAGDLAPQLLPNGRYGDGRRTWTASGIADSGRSHSLVVQLIGARQGQWKDFGNCAADEERGDMIDLLRHCRFGGDKGAAIAAAKAMLGIHDDYTPARERISPAELARLQATRAEASRQRAEARSEAEAKDRAAKIKGAKALFHAGAARPIAGTPAEAYLTGRGIGPGASGKWPGSLRFHPEVWNSEIRVKTPALLAMIVTPQGEHVGTHRIWLQPCSRRGWTKLDVVNAKKVLGTFWGGFIPMNKGSSGKSMRDMAADEPVYEAEGPEDCLLIREKLPTARIICAISLGNLGAIVFPAQAKRLVVVGDRDNKPGEVDKLERAIAAQQARGMEVSLVLPPPGFKDVNDWHLGLGNRTNVRPSASMPPVASAAGLGAASSSFSRKGAA